VLNGYQGTPLVRAALRLAALTFVRPGELRQARWAEIDFDAAEWRIPAERMKMRQPHIVPLSRQALEALTELHPLTSRSQFLFPSPRTASRPMSNNAVLAAMRRLGIDKDVMWGHGFRAMARIILDEVLAYRVDWIEHQLAHAVKDVNGRAYNRTAHLEGRKQMMQGWADYLDQLRGQAHKAAPADLCRPFKAPMATAQWELVEHELRLWATSWQIVKRWRSQLSLALVQM